MFTDVTHGRRRSRDPGPLRTYLGYAVLIHISFFGLSAFRDHVVIPAEPVDDGILFDFKVEKAQPQPRQLAPLRPDTPPVRVSPPTPKKVTSVLPKESRIDPNHENPPADIEGNANPDPELPEAPQGDDRLGDEASVEPDPNGHRPRDNGKSLRNAISGASKRGGNAHDPRRRLQFGGLGGLSTSGPPVIQGSIWSDGGKRGALKGSVCFVPASTSRLSDLDRCRAEAILFTNTLNVTPRRFTHGFPGVTARSEWFAIDFVGAFSVTDAGSYKFRLFSDDGSILWIDNQKVIDNDGQHPPLSKIGSVHLSAGPHRIRVYYFQGPRTHVALQLFVTPPDGPERLFTPKL